MEATKHRDAEQEARDIVLMIVRAAGGVFQRKTNLYKAFYFAHLYYYKETGDTLTDYPIVRMPNGPGIDKADKLFSALSEKMEVTQENYGPYTEFVFTLKTGLNFDEQDERFKAVQRAVDFVKGLQAAEVSAVSHDYSRSWNDGSDGDELDIYIDLLGEEEYNNLRRSQTMARSLVRGVFATSYA
jgi:hypothetical protein